MITPEKLAEWEALCEKATPGPWSACVLIAPYAWEIRSQGRRLFEVEERDSRDRSNINFLLVARTALPEAIAELRRLLKEGSPVRCTQCKSLEGQEHQPTCYRRGIVSIASDYRFEGRSIAALREQLEDNQKLQAEVERLQVELAGLRKSTPLDTFAPGCIDWQASLEEDHEETRL